MSRWPASCSASVTPWWVKSERPEISTVTYASEEPTSSDCSSYSLPSYSSIPAPRRRPNVGFSSQSSTRDRQGIPGGGDVVHAKHRRAPLEGQNARRQRAREPIAFRPAGESPDKPLARDADHDRASDRDDLVQAAQELEVVVEGLAEADPGVEPDSLLGDSLTDRKLEPLLQKGLDLRHDVLIGRRLLHRLGVALHVEQADLYARLAHHRRHLRVPSKRGDVVYERGARRQRLTRDRGFVGVDREGRGDP